MHTQPDYQKGLSRVLQKICEIAEKSADGDYIFRGEPKFYPEVASSLYRQYQDDIDIDDFDIAVVQTEILNEAKEYTSQTNEFEILSELQHYGGKTNLIDFTTDYLIALFFACDGAQDEPGRIILLKKESGDYEIQKPLKLGNLESSRKSVFVQSARGFIEPEAYNVVLVPEDLKVPMLDYLRKHHDISTKTIYTDLHGFIKNQGIHRSVYTEFHRGRTSHKRGDAAKNQGEKQRWYERAIVHYTEALKLKPDFPEGYNNRGMVYFDAGQLDLATQDYNMAIELKSDYDSAYNNRGIAYYSKGDFDRAIQDYNTAIELKPDYASAYNNLGIAYSKQAEYERAIQHYNMVIKLKPDFPEGYNNRGIAYYSKGDFDRAIQDYNTVIELEPDYAKAYANLGTAYYSKGDFDRAIQNYNMAIKLEPSFAGFYCNRGEALLHLREWEKAKADLITAKDMGIDIIASFHNDYEGVADFEQQNEVQLPEDIKAMLKRQ